MANKKIDRERLNEGLPERDVSLVKAEQARSRLIKAINRIDKAGFTNQFNYKNYGVQYNPIYDKETERVRTVQESGLSPQEFEHLAEMMETSPEMSVDWHIERARKIGGEVFDRLAHNDVFLNFPDREKFIRDYVEAVRKYHLQDEDFNYEVIKNIYIEAGGTHISGIRKEEQGDIPSYAET